MGMRFRRSLKLAPGLRMNLGATGASLTFGGDADQSPSASGALMPTSVSRERGSRFASGSTPAAVEVAGRHPRGNNDSGSGDRFG